MNIVSKYCGILYRLKRVLPSDTLFSLYNTLIFPHLSYCNLIWADSSNTNLHLTGGNWQKWKRVFLPCPCHEIYRDKAVGLKSCKNTWKITIFVKMWNLGNIVKIWYFVNNCLIKAWILKILLHTCDTYNYDYLKYRTFRFNFIDFQLYIDFPFQFCVFYRKIT